MPKKLKIELPELSKTATICYSDVPPLLGGVVKQIPVEEFQKLVGGSFQYSNSIYSEGFPEPFFDPKQKPTYGPSDFPVKNITQQSLISDQDIIIAKMGELGLGAFARRNFKPFECMLLYTGVIEHNKLTEKNSDYALAFGGTSGLSVNSEKIGNLTRFFQHAPENYTQATDEVKKLDSKSIPYSNENLQFWQHRNIVYRGNLTESDVAWANMTMTPIRIKDTPCLLIFNIREISEGSPLLFSYSFGYWLNRGIKPELFYKNGGIIPQDQYGYKETLVNPQITTLLQPRGLTNTKNYTPEMFREDLKRKNEFFHPVWFHYALEPISIFKLRKKLLDYNVIGKEYAPVTQHHLLQPLRHALPKEYTVEIYLRDPQQSRSVFDIIITTTDLVKWNQLTVLLENIKLIPIQIEYKGLKYDQEIILFDVTNPSNMFTQFLPFLTQFCHDGSFDKHLSNLPIIPGPTRGMLSALVAKSEIALRQIFRHNPDVTKQEVLEYYKLTGQTIPANEMSELTKTIKSLDISGAHPSQSQDKRSILETTTQRFFNHKPPFLINDELHSYKINCCSVCTQQKEANLKGLQVAIQLNKSSPHHPYEKHLKCTIMSPTSLFQQIRQHTNEKENLELSFKK